MAGEDQRTSGYPTLTTHPLTGKDRVDISHTPDGGATFTLNKGGEIDELQDYLLSAVNIPTGNNVLFVAIGNGDDSTGTKGRKDLPYALLATAIAAASSGDIVIVEGTVTEQVVLQNGVDIIVNGDWIYAGSTANGVIYDNGVLAISKITIHGNLVNNSAFAGLSNAIDLSNAGTVIDLKVNEVIQATTDGTGYALQIINGATLNMTGTLNGGIFTYDDCTFNLWGDSIRTAGTDLNGIAFNNGAIMHFHGNIDCDLGTFGIASDSMNSSCDIIVEGDITLRAGANNAVSLSGQFGSFIVKGRVSQTATGTAVALTGSANFEFWGGAHSVGAATVKVQSDSGTYGETINSYFYGIIKCDWANAAGYTIVFLSTPDVPVAILNQCVLVTTSTPTESIKDMDDGMDGLKSIVNYGVNATKSIDPDVTQLVNNANIDSNVK